MTVQGGRLTRRLTSLLLGLVLALAQVLVTAAPTLGAVATPGQQTRPAAESHAQAQPHTQPRSQALVQPHSQAQPRAQAQTQGPGRAPLRLTLEEVSPAVLRGDSDVTMTGTLTNVSDETWRAINVQSFRSAYPIVNTQHLADAAQTPVEDYVGARITEVGTFETIDAVEPGETTTFTATLPREALGQEPGVYWIGVHALGQTDSGGRDDLADGRARTFLPVNVEQSQPLPASLVLPVRASVRHLPDGSLAGAGGWARRLRPGGRLDNLLEIGRQAGASPLTWLVDPAVLRAVQRLAVGNPGTRLRPPVESTPPDQDGNPGPGATDGPGSEGTDGSGDSDAPDDGAGAPGAVTPDPETSLDPEDTTPPDPGTGAEPDPLTPQELAAAEAARTWLASFRELTTDSPVLALPYGDVDVSALAAVDSPLLDAALERSEAVMEQIGIDAQPALSSPDGFLSEAALTATPDGSVLLLSDRAVEGDGSGRILGHPFATISSGVADGGPGPEPAGSRVAVRQRLLSEAALQSMAEDRSPLVVVPPATWDPATSADLTTALDEGLLRWRPLSALMDPGADPLPDDALVAADDPAQLPVGNVRAGEALVSVGTRLEGVLADPADLVTQVSDLALAELSYFTRADPTDALGRIRDNASTLDDLLTSVRVDDNLRAVTLSGDTGAFGVTLVNPLDVPVVVAVRAEASDSLTLGPVEPVRVAPRSRRRLLLQATVQRQGVHSLTLQVTDAEGSELGSSSTISVRAAQVSGLLWFIMGGGLVMLFGAIGVRLFRRVRARRTA